MTIDDLPPLPEPFGNLVFEYEDEDGTFTGTSEDMGDGYTAEQMRAYGSSVLASRQQEGRDALRYRWLRDVAWANGMIYVMCERYGPEDWDRYIDAAISAEGKS